MGNRDLAASFVTQSTDPATTAFIRAVAADPGQGPVSPGGVWNAALAAAVTPEQIRRALYELAAAGQLTHGKLDFAQDREVVPVQAVRCPAGSK
jgi:hypothetical protein